MIFFWSPNLTYVFVVPFLSCLQVSSGLVIIVVVKVAFSSKFVVVKVATFSVAIVKVTILSDAGVKVATVLGVVDDE